MNADELRALQEPLKAKYRESPEEARVAFEVIGVVDFDSIACRIEPKVGAGEHGIVAGLHPAAGGSGHLACSAEMLLESLVACAGVTFAAVATAMSLPIQFTKIHAEAEMDFRGTLGIDRTAPIGLQRMMLVFGVDSPATDDQLAKLLQLTERYCVIMQTLRPSVPVEAKWSRVEKSISS